MENKTTILIESAVGLILLIVGMVIVIWNLYKHGKSNSIKGWPKAQGKILSALVAPADSPVGTEYMRPNQIRPVVGSETSYVPRVSYVYTVSGRTYRGDNFMYNSPDEFNDIQIKALMGRYKIGSEVPVLYNSSNPEESYLYDGDVDWWPFWVGIILVLIAAALGAHGVYLKRKGEKSASDWYDVSQFTVKAN